MHLLHIPGPTKIQALRQTQVVDFQWQPDRKNGGGEGVRPLLHIPLDITFIRQQAHRPKYPS